jgi:hypothetical protein
MHKKRVVAFLLGVIEAVFAHVIAIAAVANTERLWHVLGHIVAVIAVEMSRLLS